MTLETRTQDQPEVALDSRYGAIGISAVAAALQYRSEAKNPAYAPVTPRTDESLLEPTG
jgi:hypothetical protein